MIDFDADRNPMDVLAEEFAASCRNGRVPSISEYVRRCPQYADEIQSLFPSIVLMEQLSRKEQAQRGVMQHAAACGPLPLKKLGDFRILREIGRGGMGVVYEAEQQSLGRRVALKVLAAGSVAAPRQLQRFDREARAAANLHHNNIVPIFGMGEEDGLQYYVMQFIDGRGLDRFLAELTPNKGASGEAPAALSSATRAAAGRAPNGFTFGQNGTYWRFIAELALQVARALDYAHRQGVLHRDIKPANILLDGRGTVWVADFGLAKVLDQDQMTESGDLMGTLRYMAPEQFSGQATPASDVYGLGMTLYELATRRPAFAVTDRPHLMRLVTQQGPPRPRAADPAIPADLETIIQQATALEPAHRYNSAAALANDLQRFLADEPLNARRVSAGERLWRWSRRNPALAASFSTSFVLLMLVALVASLGYLRVDAERHKAVALAESERRAAAEARAATARADAERLRAGREHQRAEDNLQLAMDAFENIVEVRNELGSVQREMGELEASWITLQEGVRVLEAHATGGNSPLARRLLTDLCLGGVRTAKVLGDQQLVERAQSAVRLLAPQDRPAGWQGRGRPFREEP